jgi:hypothetical protein
MELIEQGWILVPTDKNYKAYLSLSLTDDQIAALKQKWLEGQIAALKQKWLEDSPVARAIDVVMDEQLEVEWRRELQLHSDGSYGKFYYQHLSMEQQHRFIDLHNSNQMKIGYPGYFYRHPFFAGN